MFDELNRGSSGSSRDGRDGHKRDGQTPAPNRRDRDQEVRPVVEREVPLGHHEGRVLAPALHAWLDGELPEAAVRGGGTARDVEFWNNVSAQMERARRMRTPEHIEAQIMAALPHHAPQLITPWYQREFVITPFAAVAVTTAIITLTVAATVVLLAP
jgi:hypothetical protein